MKRTLAHLAVASIVLAPGLALARDSTWLLCKGTATIGKGDTAEKTTLVASLLEHRASDGQSRDLGVTLLRGDHSVHGSIPGKNGSDAAAKGSKLELPKVFSGAAELASDWKTFTLDGKIDATFGVDPKAAKQPVKIAFTCEELPES